MKRHMFFQFQGLNNFLSDFRVLSSNAYGFIIFFFFFPKLNILPSSIC